MYILNIVNPIETFSLKTVTNKLDFLKKKPKKNQLLFNETLEKKIS